MKTSQISLLTCLSKLAIEGLKVLFIGFSKQEKNPLIILSSAILQTDFFKHWRPRDFVLGFYQQLIQSNKLKVINTCDEQGAVGLQLMQTRINGLGVVCVTYCVGGLKVVNATAHAL